MSLLAFVADFLRPARPLDPDLERALDRVAEGVDPVLRTAPGFERHLRAPVGEALAYCHQLTTRLPGPLVIDRPAFASDPLVHALFATADDIDAMLGRSQAVRDFLVEPEALESDHFYALLAARWHEKTQFGLALQGEVIHADVPQRVLVFGDHTLVEPASDLATLRQRLCCRGLGSLLDTFRDHLAVLRHERDGLRADLSLARAHLTALRHKTPGPDIAVPSRHLEALDQRLRERAASLMPDVLIDELAALLRAPERVLNLRPVQVVVDRLGVIQPAGAPLADGVSRLEFNELNARDRRHYLAMLVRINREEAQNAVAAARDAQRRFLLI